jgi:spermidine synthase
MARNQKTFPDQWAFDIETKSLTAGTMQAATVFGKDIAKLEAPVNSIMEPKLYQLYIADLKN